MMHTARFARWFVLVWAAGCTLNPSGDGLQEKTSGESVAVDVNAKAPAFAATTLSGQAVRLADYVGAHVVLLEFWSIFCKSCIEEMPHIEELHSKYSKDGLTVLSVNTDVFSSKRVTRFLEKAGIRPPYAVVRDARQEIVDAYGVELLPVTVIIDRDGWIRLYQEGYRPGDERRFERVVRKLLGREGAEDVTLASRGGVTAFAPAGTSLTAEGVRVGALRGKTLDGQDVVVGGGQPHLLFFWSLYCKPCRAEFPTLLELVRKYGNRGLVTYNVNVDSPRLVGRVKRFVQSHPGIPCLLDGPEGDDGDLAQALGIRVTPTVVLLDSNDTVVHAESGSSDFDALERKIHTLVGRE